MSIKKLGNEVQSRLRAAAKINSYKRAVEELVYNSLDSDSTSIAIRIDIHETFIQVIDNGSGISKSDIYLLGQRYTTSKAGDMSVRKGDPGKYGFRGESLANIIEVSSHVKITSRCEKSDETWIKLFCKGQHRDSYKTTMRPSKGTTVEIKGFLYNLCIQKKETNNITEIQSIKKFLQQVSLERTNISMSFRDNSRNEIIFTAHKNRDIYQTLSSLFEIDKTDVQELQVEKNQYKIKGFVGRNEASHNSYKWIYLNGRFLHKSTIHDIVNEYFMKSHAHNRKRLMKKKSQDSKINVKEIPYYFIFISCPQSDYDIAFNTEKTFVQFRDWNQIKLLIDKFVKCFNGNIKLKEIKVKKANDRKLLGSTQEEARKIVEKILGNKNKIQMEKGIEGKIVRKINKQKISNDKPQNKNYHGECNKKYNSKEGTIAEVLNPEQNTNLLIHMELDDNIIENSDKVFHNKMDHKKLKKSKMKRDKSTPYTDPMIKKFVYATDSVKQRCDIYSKNIKELLNKKINPAPEYIRHANIKGDEIRPEVSVKDVHKKKEKYSFSYRDAKITKENLDEISCVVPLAKANKGYLRSYDLVQTILNTQKDLCIENYTVSPQSTNKNWVYLEQSYNSNNIINVTKTKSNFTSPFTKVTFDSHKYQNHNNFVSKIKQRQKTVNNFYNFSVRKELTQSVCETKFKHRMLKKYLKKKKYEKNGKQSVNKFPCSKLDNIFNISEQKSYNIDICYSNHNPDYMETQNIYSHDRLNFKVTGNIQSTYTVIDSNVSTNIESYINHKNAITRSYEKSVAIAEEKNFKTFSHLSEEESVRDHDNELYSHEINNGCNTKILFTSYSENLDSQMINNSIEPLNVCKAIYKNHNDTNSYIDNANTLSTMSRGSKNICSNSKSIPETSSKVNVDCMLRNDMNKKSQYEIEINGKTETVFNSNVEATNEKHNFESLDFYFEMVPEWTDIVDKNQESNNFKLQDRHNFLPKGMSQIFANCNSKKVCSYNLEMDYFQDDLYNEFANNVLDNFNLFETRIQNISDNVSENFANLNKKLKNNLKFNAYSLKTARVFGQVDNKYIAAELHSDNDYLLKYLVLFDQHAVHERITLEEILFDYLKDDQWTSVDCEILAIKLNKENVIYLNNYKEKFYQLGLKWMFENDLVLINGIPKAILGKHCRQPDVVLTCIKNLITEEIKAIKSLKGNSLLYPKSITDFVFSEACRSAIKFGDVLTKNKCAMLIESLSTCKTPFQCAHGRPVMAVLLDMKTIDNEYTINMSRVSIFKNKVTK